MTLPRRTPLPRGNGLRRTSGKPKPRKSTGPTTTTREVVWTRAGGRCELCGGTLAGMVGFSVHHRLPRRMGGSSRPELNTPANLLLLCGSGTTGCHGRVEANREQAYADGLLLRDGADPTREPVMLTNSAVSAWPQVVWLTEDGTYASNPPQHDDSTGDPA